MALEYFNDRSKAVVLLWLCNILMTVPRQGSILLWLCNILMTVPRQGFYCGSVIF